MQNPNGQPKPTINQLNMKTILHTILAATLLTVGLNVAAADKGNAKKSAAGRASATAPLPTGRRLREIVAEKYPQGNVFIAAAINGPMTNPGIDFEILNREFSATTPENDFKQHWIHPEPGHIWRWERGDAYLKNCEAHQQLVRIHGPISPQCSPWARDDSRTAAELRQVMNEFLPALCKRYNKNPVVRWMDVVNETVERDGTWFGPKPGNDKWENPWTILGYDNDKNQTPLYIQEAFVIANRDAKNLKLVYNQHTKLERPGMEKVKETILYLRAKGLRVDALGWQAHIDVGWEKVPGNLEYLSELIAWAHANRLEFHVTENNVKLPKVAQPDENERAAATFAAIVRALLEHRGTGVVAWNCWRMRDYTGERNERLGLLFAEDGSPNKAYYAVQELLQNPPPPAKPQPDMIKGNVKQ